MSDERMVMWIAIGVSIIALVASSVHEISLHRIYPTLRSDLQAANDLTEFTLQVLKDLQVSSDRLASSSQEINQVLQAARPDAVYAVHLSQRLAQLEETVQKELNQVLREEKQ